MPHAGRDRSRPAPGEEDSATLSSFYPTRALGVRPGWRQRLDRFRGRAHRVRTCAATPASLGHRRLQPLVRGPAPTPASSIADARSAMPRRRGPRAPARRVLRARSPRRRAAPSARPFDLKQVVAALALQRGSSRCRPAKARRSLCVMPASLNALGGRGVHVLTFKPGAALTPAG